MANYPPSAHHEKQIHTAYNVLFVLIKVMVDMTAIYMHKMIVYTVLKPTIPMRNGHKKRELAAVMNPYIATCVRYTSSFMFTDPYDLKVTLVKNPLEIDNVTITNMCQNCWSLTACGIVNFE